MRKRSKLEDFSHLPIESRVDKSGQTLKPGEFIHVKMGKRWFPGWVVVSRRSTVMISGQKFQILDWIDEGGQRYNLPRSQDIKKPHRQEQMPTPLLVKIDKQGGLIPGGLSEGKPLSSFDRRSVSQGREVEMEHTENPSLAEEIARDHLTEDPAYYDKLEKMEKNGLAQPLQLRRAHKVVLRYLNRHG